MMSRSSSMSFSTSIIVFCFTVVAVFGTGVLNSPASLEERVVGGNNITSIEKYPFIVSLLCLESYLCSGTIISENYVLTAAHCVSYPPSWYSIVAGDLYSLLGGTRYSVVSITIHPQYTSWTIDYDFALIQIQGSFNLSSTQGTLQLPNRDEDVPPGTTAEVIGWGPNGASSKTLYAVPVNIVSAGTCEASYPGSTITHRMICTSYSEDACHGDSGSPLVAGSKQAGIASWGCIRPGTLRIFSRVASVRDWITDNSGV